MGNLDGKRSEEALRDYKICCWGLSYLVGLMGKDQLIRMEDLISLCLQIEKRLIK